MVGKLLVFSWHVWRFAYITSHKDQDNFLPKAAGKQSPGDWRLPSYPVHNSNMTSNFLDPWEANSVYLLYEICWAFVIYLFIFSYYRVASNHSCCSRHRKRMEILLRWQIWCFPTSSPWLFLIHSFLHPSSHSFRMSLLGAFSESAPVS